MDSLGRVDVDLVATRGQRNKSPVDGDFDLAVEGVIHSLFEDALKGRDRKGRDDVVDDEGRGAGFLCRLGGLYGTRVIVEDIHRDLRHP